MPHRRLFTFYQRKRVVNVNINIIAGGLTAIAIGAVIVKIVERLAPGLPTWAYTAIGTGADIIADVMLYFLLHWVANHWRPIKSDNAVAQHALEADKPPFWKDAGRLQLERAALSPLFYVMSVGGMEGLQRSGMAAGWAMIVSFSTALVITRIIHTLWGLKSGSLRDHHERPATPSEPDR